jgi:hypothetical protein
MLMMKAQEIEADGFALSRHPRSGDRGAISELSASPASNFAGSIESALTMQIFVASSGALLSNSTEANMPSRR